jgi:NAD(P)-dependent dehydrogenase (short-subunit alcohol dehydrogenase family)
LTLVLARSSQRLRTMTKTAVVTGGTGALGSSVVRAFAAAGYEVHFTASRPTAAPIDASHLHVVDLADFAAVRACADGFEEVHALVLAAGGFAASELLALSESDIDQMIDVNWKTAVHALSAFGGKMRAGSSAVLVGSQTYEGAARASTYAASKAAVVSLAKSAALEWRQAGIRVNAVLPDTIDTPANRAAMPRADFDRWAKPEELADVILWLCSPGAAIVSGNSLRVGR